MAKVTYRGPGDGVELDGLRIERGKPVELLGDQVSRLRTSDAHAVVEVETDGPEDARTIARIRALQDEQREKLADERDKDETETAEFVVKNEKATADRTAKKSAERDRVRAESARRIDELRSTPTRGTAKKETS